MDFSQLYQLQHRKKRKYESDTSPSTDTKASLHESTPPSRTEPLTLPLHQWTADSGNREDAFTFSDCQPTKHLRYDCRSSTTPAVNSTHSSHIVTEPFNSHCASNNSSWQVRKARINTSPQPLSTQYSSGNGGDVQQGVRLINFQRPQSSLQELRDSETQRRLRISFSNRPSYAAYCQSLGRFEPCLRVLEEAKEPSLEASTPTTEPPHKTITESSWVLPYSTEAGPWVTTIAKSTFPDFTSIRTRS
jgi:hypothetical protein